MAAASWDYCPYLAGPFLAVLSALCPHSLSSPAVLPHGSGGCLHGPSSSDSLGPLGRPSTHGHHLGCPHLRPMGRTTCSASC